MYHDFSRCRGVRRNVAGWPTESVTRWSTWPGTQGGESPGQRGTPVVAHDVRPGDLQVGQDRHDVPGQLHERVGLDGFWLVGAPVAAQVGDDDLESRTGEGRYLVPPEPTGIGKTVQQNDRRSLPRDLVLDTHSVHVYPGQRALLSPARGPACHCRGPRNLRSSRVCAQTAAWKTIRGEPPSTSPAGRWPPTGRIHRYAPRSSCEAGQVRSAVLAPNRTWHAASRWPVGIQLAGIRSGTDVAAQERY